ncbi:cyclic lactone autoinducer peptide [Clostridium sp. WB02_MRS01]|nr:cyclic lactone autoinducer peptide [Clostridium sp. WB02_MRS01]MSS07207.1 cyclic lactone autoinducer peptide [Clostridium sp. WB02_MRS01]
MKFMDKVSNGIASLALKTALANVNSCCMYVMYQPKVPKEIESLKRN